MTHKEAIKIVKELGHTPVCAICKQPTNSPVGVCSRTRKCRQTYRYRWASGAYA